MKDVLDMSSAEFGQWLAKMRERYNVKLSSVASLLGITADDVENYEKDGYCRTIYRQEIARFFASKGSIEVEALEDREFIPESQRAAWLRQKRQEHGLRMLDVAAFLGMDSSRVGAWERGRSKCSDKLFRKLYEFFAKLDKEAQHQRPPQQATPVVEPAKIERKSACKSHGNKIIAKPEPHENKNKPKRQSDDKVLEFSNWLRAQRKKRKLSAHDIAQILGVSDAAVTNWECGRPCPPVRQMMLRDIFDSMDDIPVPGIAWSRQDDIYVATVLLLEYANSYTEPPLMPRDEIVRLVGRLRSALDCAV